jgi:hypothetical protein
VVAVIAFNETDIYATDPAPGERPTRIIASDPRGRYRRVRHHAGNPSGTYEDDGPEYWREITEALARASAILVFGHGDGKANASHHWVAYVENTAQMSRRNWWLTCESTSTTSMNVNCCAWQLYFEQAPHHDLGANRTSGAIRRGRT